MVEKMVKDSIEIEEEELEQDQYLVFTVKAQEFGIQAVRVQEISQVLATTEVPNALSYVEGVMNLRGRLASVINFRRKLGFEAKAHDEDTRTIVVEMDSFPVGIMVDSVEEVIKITDEKVQALPESTTTSISRDYMTGVGMVESRLIILLDIDKVLTSTEVIELGEIKKIAEEAKETLEPVETKQKTDKAREAPEAAATNQIADEAKKAPEQPQAIRPKDTDQKED
jgi:purine-binding chemotaxis protein CheW